MSSDSPAKKGKFDNSVESDKIDENDKIISDEEEEFIVNQRNGRKTLGRQRIPIKFIADRDKRISTFSKRKSGLMKKAFELAELTGSEILLLVASETNHVYTFSTNGLKAVLESDIGKNLIANSLNVSRYKSDDETSQKSADCDENLDNEPTKSPKIRTSEPSKQEVSSGTIISHSSSITASASATPATSGKKSSQLLNKDKVIAPTESNNTKIGLSCPKYTPILMKNDKSANDQILYVPVSDKTDNDAWISDQII